MQRAHVTVEPGEVDACRAALDKGVSAKERARRALDGTLALLRQSA